MNLAAFLAGSLSQFGLPTKKIDSICPSVFKVSRLMAHAERFALAISILASIYKGLKDISSSSNLNVRDIIFSIQYVYEWIGDYFDAFYYCRHHHNGARMCILIGERMAKYLDLAGAR